MTPEKRKAISRQGGLAKKGYRAKHTLEAQEARKLLVERIICEQDALLTAWLDVAKGYWVESKDVDGNSVRLYKRAPNAAAIRDILDRVFGKHQETSRAASTENCEPVATIIFKPIGR